jgi:hypothetical protein
MGKSTGRWALSVWTHHMKDVEYLQYNSTSYTGPAVRLGAGIQVEEAYEAAHAHGYLVVGGDCATVGVAGGYLQGLYNNGPFDLCPCQCFDKCKPSQVAATRLSAPCMAWELITFWNGK